MLLSNNLVQWTLSTINPVWPMNSKGMSSSDNWFFWQSFSFKKLAEFDSECDHANSFKYIIKSVSRKSSALMKIFPRKSAHGNHDNQSPEAAYKTYVNKSLLWFCLILHDEGSVLIDTGGRKCARTCAWRCATSGSSLSSVRIAWEKCTIPGDKNGITQLIS
jgi:hypothetical protein